MLPLTTRKTPLKPYVGLLRAMVIEPWLASVPLRNSKTESPKLKTAPGSTLMVPSLVTNDALVYSAARTLISPDGSLRTVPAPRM